MAEINSYSYRTSVEGTEDSDSINIMGDYLTVQAYSGDDLIEIYGRYLTHDNIIYAGGDNDSVTVQSNATVYGENGDDYFEISASSVVADGGAGDDTFYIDTSNLNSYLTHSVSNVTINGGNGNDTIKINPKNSAKINAVVTDFSTSDVFVNENDFNDGEYMTYDTVSNGIVIKDADPNTFSVTLSGVSDISQIYDATYQDAYGDVKTFGELFGDIQTSATESTVSTTTTTAPTTQPTVPPDTTTTTTQPTVPAIEIVDPEPTPTVPSNENSLPSDEVVLIDTTTDEKVTSDELDTVQAEVEISPNGDTYYIINHNTYIIDQTQINNKTDINQTTNYVDASTTNNIDNSTNITNTTNIDNTTTTNDVDIYNDNRTYNDNSTNITNTSVTNTTTTNNTLVNVNNTTNNISNTTTNVSVGISLNQNIMTINNQFTEQLWLNGTNLITGQPTRYSNNDANIVRIDASQLTGSRILAGNGQNNLITAGSGGSSMWGSGAGTHNTLQGGGGRDMIFWLAEHDELHNFQMGASGDVLNLQNLSISEYSRDASYMSFTATDGSSVRFVNPHSANDIIPYTTDGNNVLTAKIGLTGQANNLVYENGVTFYSGSTQAVDILEVNGGESRNIALDGSFGSLYDNVDNINASSSYGNNQLFGNIGNNEIRAGSGKDTLWGGNGDDTLIAGSAENTFRYGIGEGNDVIINSLSSDVVDLYNMSLSEIVSTDVVGSDLVVTAYNGQSLKIQGENGTSTFMFADRSAYNYSREMHTWNRLN